MINTKVKSELSNYHYYSTENLTKILRYKGLLTDILRK